MEKETINTLENIVKYAQEIVTTAEVLLENKDSPACSYFDSLEASLHDNFNELEDLICSL